MSWDIVYAKHAQKDAQKLAASRLKNKAQLLLTIMNYSLEPLTSTYSINGHTD